MLVKENLGPSVFDETYKNSCDYKTWVDLAGEPGRFVYVPERLMGHRIYEESSTSKNLKDGTRQAEDLEILSSLWPAPVAKLIYKVYALGEKSNGFRRLRLWCIPLPRSSGAGDRAEF